MRTKTGKVVSNLQNQTIIIEVTTLKTHPKYKKSYKVSKKFYAHNPENKKFEIGDEITVYETKPISKSKRWQTAPAVHEAHEP
jgi:small subunit ribosomal protein S17